MRLALLATVLLAGCGIINQPKVDSLSDGIAYTAAAIETAAQEVGSLCAAAEVGGECTGLINSDTRDRLKVQLQDALDAVILADMALEQDNDVDAGDYLGRAESLLTLVQTVLEGLQ